MRKGTEPRLSTSVVRSGLAALVLLQVCCLVGCSGNRRPTVPSVGSPLQRGMASWYGPNFHGRRTANGERYDQNALTAAHPSLPFGTLVEVRNPRTGESVVVRINDRGPFAKRRVIDLSHAAARQVSLVGPGTGLVELYPAPGGFSASSRFTVQVAAFNDRGRARALQGELMEIYPETVVQSDGTWSRVRIGTFEDRDRAELLRRELAILGLSSVVVAAQ